MDMCPFGVDGEWIRHAVRCTLVANANAPKGKRFKVADFMPKAFSGPRQPQQWKQMRQLLASQLADRLKPVE